MLKDMQVKQRQNRNILAVALIVAALVNWSHAYTQTPDASYLSGCASLNKGDYQHAVENFSAAISRNNADEQLFIKRGSSFLHLKDYTAAAEDFNEANLIYPGIADIWLARLYAVLGENANAISFLKRHLQSEFRLREDSIKKDPAFDRLQVTSEWETLWEQDWYSKEEKIISEASYYCKRKSFDEAASLLTNALEASPDNKELLALRGAVMFEQGNYAGSVSDYSAALDLDKNFTTIFPLRALAYFKAGRYRDALNDYNKSIKLDPAGFRLYLQRAAAWAAIQSWEPAIKDMLFYLKYFENDQQAGHQCGEYYYEAGDYINALKYFNRNLKDDPNNSSYYKSRGKTYLKTATYRYAIGDLSMSLDLNPDDPETWMYLGIAKLESGDKENGCSDLERARGMGESRAIEYIVENCH
jgi:tetratricopeptide (TPR) repeat protein